MSSEQPPSFQEQQEVSVEKRHQSWLEENIRQLGPEGLAMLIGTATLTLDVGASYGFQELARVVPGANFKDFIEIASALFLGGAVLDTCRLAATNLGFRTKFVKRAEEVFEANPEN